MVRVWGPLGGKLGHVICHVGLLGGGILGARPRSEQVLFSLEPTSKPDNLDVGFILHLSSIVFVLDSTHSSAWLRGTPSDRPHTRAAHTGTTATLE